MIVRGRITTIWSTGTQLINLNRRLSLSCYPSILWHLHLGLIGTMCNKEQLYIQTQNKGIAWYYTAGYSKHLLLIAVNALWPMAATTAVREFCQEKALRQQLPLVPQAEKIHFVQVHNPYRTTRTQQLNRVREKGLDQGWWTFQSFWC